MSMFKTMQSVRGAVTLFHDPTSAASNAIFKSITSHFADPASRKFDIQITNDAPTDTQLKTIEEIDPSITEKNFPKPLLVDWFNGKIARDQTTADKIFSELGKQ